MLQTANQARAYGEKNSVPELTTPELPLSQADGDRIAAVVCGLGRADAYFRGPYEGGALYCLITNTPLAQPVPADLPRVARVLGSVIMNPLPEPRRMAKSYLEYEGFTVQETAASLTGSDAARGTVMVEFDAAGRIANIKARGGAV